MTKQENINFNPKEWLDSRGIKYHTGGKNTIKGAISLRCCFHNDLSNHLNLFNDGWAKCWHCGNKSIKEVIRGVENCSWKEVYSIIKQFPLNDQYIESQEEKVEIHHPSTFQMPKEFSSTFPENYKKYLELRNFDWRHLRSKYGLLTSGNFGQYKFRIIIPIIMDGKIISFIGRDITGKQKLKYLNCPESISVLPREEWVFNIDNVKTDTCIICEGAFDAIRIGDNAVSFLTTNFTNKQLLRLKNKGVDKFYIMYDNDEAGENQSERLESCLSWAKEINYIDLPEGVNDPAELSEKEVMELRRMIF